MDPPHAHWADHNHSDENVNLTFTMFSGPRIMAPPPPYWAHHHPSRECPNLLCLRVPEQRPRFPPSPSRPDSGYDSRSQTHDRPRKILRVVNTTPTPPATPPSRPNSPFAQDEESSFRAEECALTPYSESERGSLNEMEEERRKKREKLRGYPSGKNNNNNIFSRGLRRARKCIGAKVMATGKKITPCGSGAGNDGAIGGLDGEVEDRSGRRRGRDDGEGSFGKALKKVKRSALFWRSEPERLRPAKVRMLLD